MSIAATDQKVRKILTSRYSTQSYLELMQEIFYGMKIVAPNQQRKEFSNFSSHIENYTHIGNYVSPKKENVAILAVCLKGERYVENSRSTQRSYAKKLIQNAGSDAAMIAFYTDGEPRWRISFVRLDYEMRFENGKLKAQENLTPAKRYSYLVGEGEPCHTAVDRFRRFINEGIPSELPTLADLEDAFSVEKVTNEFFALYCEKFHQLCDTLRTNEDFMLEAEQHNYTVAQFAKKLMGQIVFLYFLQKKGWLGVNAWPNRLTEAEFKRAYYARGAKSRELIPQVYKLTDDGTYRISTGALNALDDSDEETLAYCVKGQPWGTGPKDFMRRLFQLAESKNENFFEHYLEPLFYEALNQNRGENGYCPKLHCRIPFLSGGLFEPIDGYAWKENNFAIPNEVFSNAHEKGLQADGILDIFDRYNFTMSEDEPMEREVAIDPEMLGKVFENLLEIQDRKSKGAFYTPREIVHYMCQESLIAYLVRETGVSEIAIRDFILYGDFMKDEDTIKSKREGNGGMYISEELFFIDDNGEIAVDRLKDVDKALATIRVADPAVGSGAFPLGMLNEIVRARQNITAYMAIPMNSYDRRYMYQTLRSPYALKYETIKNCIFAADIDPSAVDIAQLRLWLSLVIDDEINPLAQNELEGHRNPSPLPNLECNIVCGNSLMDEFEGYPLINQSHVLGTASVNQQVNLLTGVFEQILPELIKAQDDLFRCKNTDEKVMLKGRIADLRDALVRVQLQGANPQVLERYVISTQQASKPYVLWQLDFARVFREKAGFDIVIGNPPYRLCQPSNTDTATLEYYKTHFKVASYKIDLFHLFFEKGIMLLKTNGILSYITPNTYLTNKYIKPLRKYILDTCTIHQIVNHDKVFIAASVDTATILMSKSVSIKNSVKVLQSEKFIFTEVCRKEQENWLQDQDYVFNINPHNAQEFQNCIQLGTICKTYFGIQAFDRKASVSSTASTTNHLPMIDGGDIHPYSYAIPQLYFHYLPENIKSGGDWGVYSRKRIVVRQIGQTPVVGLCAENILCSNTLYSIYPKDDSYDIMYILACLSSSIIRDYWRAKYSDNKALFPKIKGFQLKELPIPIVSREKQKEVIDLVEQIISVKQKNAQSDTLDLERKIDLLLATAYGLG